MEAAQETLLKRLAIVTTFPANQAVGGVAAYSWSLVNALRARGTALEVLAQQDPQPEATFAKPSWRFGSGFRKSVLKAVDEVRPDVVHIQHEPFLYGHGIGALAALQAIRDIKKTEAAVVVTLHGVPFPLIFERRSAAPSNVRLLANGYLRALGMVASRVDRFIVHEDEQRESLLTAGIGREKILVIPHGIELLENSSKREHGPFTVGTFGYLTPYKDPEFLLAEFTRLREDMPDAQLLFSLSEHPRRTTKRATKRFQRIRAQAELEPGVTFLDHIPVAALTDFITRCHLIVAPYKYPVSASGVVCTSLGAGVPVLLPKGFGFVSNILGWSFENKAGGLASALRRQATQLPQMKRELQGVVGRSLWSRVAVAHQDLYEKL